MYFPSVPAFTRAMALEEVEFLKREFRAEDDQVVLCHGDAWWTNMVYNKEKGNK